MGVVLGIKKKGDNKMDKYLITNEHGDYMDYDGEFGARNDAIEFSHFQAIAIANATGWDYEEA